MVTEIPGFKDVYRRARLVGRGICNARVVEWKGTEWIAKSSDGATVDAMNNEVGAYLLADALGYCFVPETMMVRDNEWEFFTIQKRVSNFKHWHDVDSLTVTPDIRRKLAHIYLFDYLIQNADRHGGNFLLVDGKQPIAIDHHITFGHGDHFVGVEYNPCVDKSVLCAEFVYRFNHSNLNELKDTIKSERFDRVTHRMRLLTRHAWQPIRDIEYNEL